MDGEFGPAPVPLAADFIFNVNGAITDDATPEGDEGFILYFEFDEDDIDPADFSRLNVGVGAILITIWDDDSECTLPFSNNRLWCQFCKTVTIYNYHMQLH